MAKKHFITDFREGESISETFNVGSRNRLVTRSGKPYLSLTLGDKTGTISAKVWDNADAIHANMGSADFVHVRGTVEKYMNELQLKVDQLRVVRTEDVDLADFLPAGTKDPEEMLNALRGLSETVENRFLRSLLDDFFADSELMEKLKVCPGAKHLHHSFVGGLLEHTLSVTKICDWVCGHYEKVNRDLVMVGAILHDIGKVYELTASPAFDYTTEGRLLGHLILGCNVIGEKIQQIQGFPRELELQVLHLVLSHHGSYEFRSPVVPKTVEAMLLNQVDDLDAKVRLTQDYIEQARSDPSEFTPYHKLLERYFYKGAAANNSG